MDESEWIARENWRCLSEEEFFENVSPAPDVVVSNQLREPAMGSQENYVYKYEKLQVYRMARVLRKQFYQFSKSFPAEERYALASQLRRSSMSVVLNIVEGSLRRTGKEQARFTEVAHGSLHEAFACILEAEDEKYVPPGTQHTLRKEVHFLGRSLHKLLEFQKNQPPQP